MLHPSGSGRSQQWEESAVRVGRSPERTLVPTLSGYNRLPCTSSGALPFKPSPLLSPPPTPPQPSHSHLEDSNLILGRLPHLAAITLLELLAGVHLARCLVLGPENFTELLAEASRHTRP